ncbi:hypothetical protein QA584_23380 [Anaerocolumna sp. AGMB13025]|nr:hypothetical protein [Anaerocolumna sp. AGMB13025]WFR56526.1 hypothetical protein QA584_23380 [Anaerocolumna sp. AGMB13025]
MEDLRREELEMATEATENISLVTLFDDCESGFLAKKDKLITWLLS